QPLCHNESLWTLAAAPPYCQVRVPQCPWFEAVPSYGQPYKRVQINHCCNASIWDSTSMGTRMQYTRFGFKNCWREHRWKQNLKSTTNWRWKHGSAPREMRSQS